MFGHGRAPTQHRFQHRQRSLLERIGCRACGFVVVGERLGSVTVADDVENGAGDHLREHQMPEYNVDSLSLFG